MMIIYNEMKYDHLKKDLGLLHLSVIRQILKIYEFPTNVMNT